MLKVVDNESAIRRHQRQFARSFRTPGCESIPVRLGHPGASEKGRVVWAEALGIWAFSRKIAGSRYWNAFGVERPADGAALSITCEINFPLCGIDRRTGGVFAEDRTGRVFVVHRGKLGGGRKGVGKSLFENHYRGVWEVMDDGGEETPVAVIGALHSPRFARQIALFVRKIARIKEAAVARSTQAEFTFDELTLHEEWIGGRYEAQRHETGAACDRGLIIRDLADHLKARGFRTGNDGRIDLVVLDGRGRIGAVVEVLTGNAPEDLHAAAMRLLLNALDLPGTPALILLAPGTPDPAFRESLKRLRIGLAGYEWRESRAIFPGLGALLP